MRCARRHFSAAVPIMDGLSATRAICGLVSSGLRPHTPIVVRDAARQLLGCSGLCVPDAASIDDSQALTASCSEEERARCAEAGMADLMPKPIQLAKLQASAVNVALCDAFCAAR